MSPIKVIHRSVATLNLPRPTPALITYAQQIVTSMTNNASFPAPTPTLASVLTAINDLHNAEAAALARTKGAASARNDKRTVLVTLLQELKGYVQARADANMENGATIIQSAGLAVKKSPTRAPRVFAVKPGAVSGSAKLVAASAGARSSYEWQYSLDAGKTWVSASATIQAKTVVTGLTPGATVEFRYRAITAKAGEGNWSQTVTLLVN
jgi:hypothetical protein